MGAKRYVFADPGRPERQQAGERQTGSRTAGQTRTAGPVTGFSPASQAR